MKKLPTFHLKEKLTIARGVPPGSYGCLQVFVVRVLRDIIVVDRSNHGDLLHVLRRAEGVQWVRGWHTPAARAMRTVAALRGDQ